MEWYETAVSHMIERDVVSKGDQPNYSANLELTRGSFRKLSDAARTGEARKFWKVYLEYFDIGEDANPNILINRASALVKLGEKEKALDALATAVDQKAFLMPFVHVDPKFDELRSEPRFQAILRKMNF
jgi:hypothetical protein